MAAFPAPLAPEFAAGVAPSATPTAPVPARLPQAAAPPSHALAYGAVFPPTSGQLAPTSAVPTAWPSASPPFTQQVVGCPPTAQTVPNFVPPPPHAVMANVPPAKPCMEPWVVALIVSLVIIGAVVMCVFACWKPFGPGNDEAPCDPPPSDRPAVTPPHQPQQSYPALPDAALQAVMTSDADINNHIMYGVQTKGMSPAAAQQWAIRRVQEKRSDMTRQPQPQPQPPQQPSQRTAGPGDDVVMPSADQLFPQTERAQTRDGRALPPGLTPLQLT